MHDNRPFIIQGEENYKRFLETGKEHNLTKELERFNKHHKNEGASMERLTYRDILGISIDKNEDCPTLSICWNCDIPPRKCNYLNDALEKLADYEDAEEQGLLLRLPCKVGDKVWAIASKCDADMINEEICENISSCDICPYEKEYVVFEDIITNIVLFDMLLNNKFGKTIFLTKEEAEQALKQMGE